VSEANLMFRCCRRLCAFVLFYFTCVAAFSQDNSQSLADMARKMRKETSDEVRMNDADTKKLLDSVDRIFAFVVEDTGMPKRAAVKRRMVGKPDVEKFMTGRLAREEYTQRFAQTELSLRKFGFLPRDFNLREFLVKATGQQVAGYYDEDTKTISLLNWVPSDHQQPILAHELTHALQDQNYDLKTWMRGTPQAKGSKENESSHDDGAVARKAVVEGQAMVVYLNYMLAPIGRNLEDTPGLIYQMEEPAVKAVQDSNLMHAAPMIMRESGSFAYKQGLIFEGELLHKGGKKMAFAGVFARPPRNSHEVMMPDAYINSEKLPAVAVPEMSQFLGADYEIFDSGSIGQLDVCALMKQYGERRNADEISSAWQGGAYVAFRRKDKDKSSDATPTTADLDLVYVSRWKTPQAAESFARFYTNAVSQRYQTATVEDPPVCAASKCPVAAAQILTEEGPVIVEQWADNSVVVSESFDPALAAKVQTAVHDGVMHASNSSSDSGYDSLHDELGFRLYEIPAFQQFGEQVGIEIAREMAARTAH
jgi:hypothetical protein